MSTTFAPAPKTLADALASDISVFVCLAAYRMGRGTIALMSDDEKQAYEKMRASLNALLTPAHAASAGSEPPAALEQPVEQPVEQSVEDLVEAHLQAAEGSLPHALADAQHELTRALASGLPGAEQPTRTTVRDELLRAGVAELEEWRRAHGEEVAKVQRTASALEKARGELTIAQHERRSADLDRNQANQALRAIAERLGVYGTVRLTDLPRVLDKYLAQQQQQQALELARHRPEPDWIKDPAQSIPRYRLDARRTPPEVRTTAPDEGAAAAQQLADTLAALDAVFGPAKS